MTVSVDIWLRGTDFATTAMFEGITRPPGVWIDDETRVPQFDPETFESSIPGLFLAGGVISGRDTSAIFIENGRFHGETIVEVIASRR